ncbi:tail fiber [Stenotrophomonas phage vB_SmeS_BUCT700]|uniref:Tail fiber n=1 Tax=Stenotrophomonas phage vB_SmeS_BUCT700 TaxID=2924895 RepID=A0AAE9GCR1_9CAUD|nr:tail fiber [Stenotrophomonas phage vB_SmeS_BUCT700]UNY50268.1 tail fiber [Stenotrophomonas phage vB_SmeS_BUCT703]
MHFRLFNKPAAFDIKTGTPTMWIDGAYDDYVPGEPYEGSVDIHGGVGLMKVKVLGANIPPGASVFIDQLRKRVVVKWMKYSPPTIEVKGVPNGSFEDESFWEFVGASTPARVETGWSPNGKGNLTYRDQKGEYRVRGAWAPVSSNTRQVTISGKVEHGKSSKGNASCGVGLSWYDADKNLIREDIGSIVSNGGKGRWYDTKAAYTPNDKNIKYVRPLVVFDRRKQNHPIHAGQIEWDHVYVDGYDEDDILWVEVEVTDSLGNKARHKGNIEVTGTYMISQLYPWHVDDDEDNLFAPLPDGIRTLDRSMSFREDELATPMVGLLSVEAKTSLHRVAVEADPLRTPLPSLLSVVSQEVVKRISMETQELFTPLPSIASVTRVQNMRFVQDIEQISAPMVSLLSVTRNKV